MTFKSRRSWFALALLLGGCAGANPFIAARFAGGLTGTGAGGGQTTQPASDIQDTCDLSGERKVFGGFLLRNSSQRVVQYSITFVASAGTGGFVCNDDVDDYQRAGYRALPLDASTQTVTIGCDPVPLLRGTQLLGLRFSGSIAAFNGGGVADDGVDAASPLNGSVRIPVPELIVVGDNQSSFICQGNNACTQGGFVYSDIAGNVIQKITASRTQGTVCNARVGNLPEWRLFDPNLPDLSANAFQYTAGSSIRVRILDRALNVDPNANQAVWFVLSVDGDVIHQEQP